MHQQGVDPPAGFVPEGTQAADFGEADVHGGHANDLTVAAQDSCERSRRSGEPEF
jgi:hypothetical protein